MSRTSRRQFAKTLTAAGVALVAVDAAGDTKLVDVVKAQYQLTDEEAARVATTLNQFATAAERLRQFQLVNSDEPDITFSSLTKRW